MIDTLKIGRSRDEPGRVAQDRNLDRPMPHVEPSTEADPDEIIRPQVLGLELLKRMLARGLDLNPSFPSMTVLNHYITYCAAISGCPSRPE
jgi:hypothetical protein